MYIVVHQQLDSEHEVKLAANTRETVRLLLRAYPDLDDLRIWYVQDIDQVLDVTDDFIGLEELPLRNRDNTVRWKKVLK